MVVLNRGTKGTKRTKKNNHYNRLNVKRTRLSLAKGVVKHLLSSKSKKNRELVLALFYEYYIDPTLKYNNTLLLSIFDKMIYNDKVTDYIVDRGHKYYYLCKDMIEDLKHIDTLVENLVKKNQYNNDLTVKRLGHYSWSIDKVELEMMGQRFWVKQNTVIESIIGLKCLLDDYKKPGITFLYLLPIKKQKELLDNNIVIPQQLHIFPKSHTGEINSIFGNHKEFIEKLIIFGFKGIDSRAVEEMDLGEQIKEHLAYTSLRGTEYTITEGKLLIPYIDFWTLKYEKKYLKHFGKPNKIRKIKNKLRKKIKKEKPEIEAGLDQYIDQFLESVKQTVIYIKRLIASNQNNNNNGTYYYSNSSNHMSNTAYPLDVSVGGMYGHLTRLKKEVPLEQQSEYDLSKKALKLKKKAIKLEKKTQKLSRTPGNEQAKFNKAKEKYDEVEQMRQKRKKEKIDDLQTYLETEFRDRFDEFIIKPFTTLLQLMYMTSDNKKYVKSICTFFGNSAYEFDSRKGSEIKHPLPILFTRLGSPFNDKKSWHPEYNKIFFKKSLGKIIKHIKRIQIKPKKQELVPPRLVSPRRVAMTQRVSRQPKHVHTQYVQKSEKPKPSIKTRKDYTQLFGLQEYPKHSTNYPSNPFTRINKYGILKGGSRKTRHFSKKMKGKTRTKINKGNRRYSRKTRTNRKTRTIKKIRK